MNILNGCTYVIPESEGLAFDNFVPVKDEKCTCGAIISCAPYPATGHSDWCNLVKSDTEEFPF